jgi:hypothetical protein
LKEANSLGRPPADAGRHVWCHGHTREADKRFVSPFDRRKIKAKENKKEGAAVDNGTCSAKILFLVQINAEVRTAVAVATDPQVPKKRKS